MLRSHESYTLPTCKIPLSPRAVFTLCAISLEEDGHVFCVLTNLVLVVKRVEACGRGEYGGRTGEYLRGCEWVEYFRFACVYSPGAPPTPRALVVHARGRLLCRRLRHRPQGAWRRPPSRQIRSETVSLAAQRGECRQRGRRLCWPAWRLDHKRLLGANAAVHSECVRSEWQLVQA